MKIDLENLVIETIPLPLAGVSFSDAIHKMILEHHHIDAGAMLYEKSPNSYYFDSVIGLNQFSETEKIFSAFCSKIANRLAITNGETYPLSISVNNSSEFQSYLRKEGLKHLRVFKISDYLNTSGFWLMFFKNSKHSEFMKKKLILSPDSPLLINALKDTIKNQSGISSTEDIISNWVRLLDIRDKETEGHTNRVAKLALQLGQASGLLNDELKFMYQGALLHDIGKIVIPNEILHKKGPLSNEEWKIMKLHPIIANELLSKFNLPKSVLNIPLYHHERWDGSGYPHGLKKEEIPFVARIFAIVDVWDALNSDRPYRKSFSSSQAKAHIKKNSGIEFDPKIVNIFLDLPL